MMTYFRYILVLLLSIQLFAACNSSTAYPEGKKLYELHCSGCHGKKGEGLEALIPPLANADMLQNSGIIVACWIKNGLEGKIIVNGVEYDNAMPANKRLSDIEIANILNFILNSWGNQQVFINPDEVKKTLINCQ
jgi:mono/diheme cytochrome c family protein